MDLPRLRFDDGAYRGPPRDGRAAPLTCTSTSRAARSLEVPISPGSPLPRSSACARSTNPPWPPRACLPSPVGEAWRPDVGIVGDQCGGVAEQTLDDHCMDTAAARAKAVALVAVWRTMRDMGGTAELVEAAGSGDLERVTGLLGGGSPVDGRDEEHRTALDRALWAGQHEAVRLLLAAGANTEQPIGQYAETLPLRFTAERGMQATARILLEAGAEPDGRLCEGRATALMMAATEGHEGIAQMLLDHGADLESVGRDQTPLESVASQGGSGAGRRALPIGV
ncbi:ankyrin repeat domain-containing protein [Streptomyces niveus]|uniref:ankyrin repeat domain-containing protein n=1 Tax=Streptomyces niveus TaxID=193462 RepID=UPI003698C910